MKHSLMLFILILIAPSLCLADLPALKVTENNRYLETEDGEPFFYLGDTAWELFHRLNREEADLYLNNRVDKGFTVIQAVVFAQLGGQNSPNAYGDRPFNENNPAQPNEAYFEHVDYIVNKAESLGLYVAMLPTWGSHWTIQGGKESIFNPENSRAYGEFLGERYKEKPIIWVLGGDQNIHFDEEHEVITAMAEGLQSGDDGRNLITFHPRGPGQSSDYFHDAEWLDFNMNQSSHAAKNHDNGLFIAEDWQLDPPKPTLDAEPRYECINVGFYYDDVSRLLLFDDDDVRQAAYWALFSGACGHTYGHNSVWQMYDEGRGPVIDAQVPWHQALDHPGAFQVGHARKLYESRPFTKLIPDDSFVVDGPQYGPAKIKACRANDNSFAFVYSSQGEPFTIKMDVVDSLQVKATWFDPRYGISHGIHTLENVGYQTFTPPTSGEGQDWILVLDDARLGFEDPGY